MAGVFVPAVMALAAGTLVAWIVSGHAFEKGLVAAVSVLIIACPCAMGLATPAAVMVGAGRAAGLGIVFKGGDVLERSGDLDVVVLDKTGTITRARCGSPMPSPQQAFPTRSWWARRLPQSFPSEHPIGRAIVAGARAQSVEPQWPQDFSWKPASPRILRTTEPKRLRDPRRPRSRRRRTSIALDQLETRLEPRPGMCCVAFRRV